MGDTSLAGGVFAIWLDGGTGSADRGPIKKEPCLSCKDLYIYYSVTHRAKEHKHTR